METFVVGVDMHPDSFAGAAFTGTNPVDCKKVWTHSKVETSDWEKWLTRHVPKGSIIVMEASGNTFALAADAGKLGYNPIVLESVRVGQLSKSYCKNDKDDAIKLAKIYFSGLATTVWIPDEITKARREILSANTRSVKDSTRTKNRLRGFLTAQKIRLKKGTSLTDPKTEKKLISDFEWSNAHKEILSILFLDLRHANTQRKQLKEIMAREVLSNQTMVKLMRLCGLNIKTAYALIAMIGDINRFKNPKKLVAYLGLTPKTVRTGNSGYDGGITKKGRRDVKSMLIQSAQAILASKNTSGEKLRKWGHALIFRKERNVAVSAVARKLIVAVWYLLKGFMPEIIDITKDTEDKVRRLATDLGIAVIQTLGYANKIEFIKEYKEIILLRC